MATRKRTKGQTTIYKTYTKYLIDPDTIIFIMLLHQTVQDKHRIPKLEHERRVEHSRSKTERSHSTLV